MLLFFHVAEEKHIQDETLGWEMDLDLWIVSAMYNTMYYIKILAQGWQIEE